MAFFRSQVNKVDNAHEIFGKSVACSLKRINDDHTKEYAKQGLQNHSYPHLKIDNNRRL